MSHQDAAAADQYFSLSGEEGSLAKVKLAWLIITLPTIHRVLGFVDLAS